jgi:hypothetical protein
VAPPVQQASTIPPRLPQKTLLATFRRTVSTHSSKNVDRAYNKLKQYKRPLGLRLQAWEFTRPAFPFRRQENAHGHQQMSLSLSLMRETAG